MKTAWVHHADGAAYDAVTAFLCRKIWGKAKALFPGTALVVLDGEKPIAAALFNNWDKDAGTIEITAASDSKRWATRSVIRQMAEFVFNETGCQAAIMRCDPANFRLSRMLTAYGFDGYEIPHIRGRGKSEKLFILTDAAWRANGFHKENQNGR
jgi:hypothetical protein